MRIVVEVFLAGRDRETREQRRVKQPAAWLREAHEVFPAGACERDDLLRGIWVGAEIGHLEIVDRQRPARHRRDAVFHQRRDESDERVRIQVVEKALLIRRRAAREQRGVIPPWRDHHIVERELLAGHRVRWENKRQSELRAVRRVQVRAERLHISRSGKLLRHGLPCPVTRQRAEVYAIAHRAADSLAIKLHRHAGRELRGHHQRNIAELRHGDCAFRPIPNRRPV